MAKRYSRPKPGLKNEVSSLISKTNPDKTPEDINTNSTLTEQVIKKPRIKKKKTPLLDRFVSAVNFFKLELVIGLAALTLSLGQYFQSGISVRITVTNTWRDGYTSEIRNRVSKFRYLYNKKWIPSCKNDNNCINLVNASVEKIVDPQKYYNENLENDVYIKELVSDELDTQLFSDTVNGESLSDANKKTQKKQAIIAAILNYRNSIIEALNTFETVKAVIDARPLYRWHILYSDTLEDRYKDTINESKRDLEIFIKIYRQVFSRNTPAWKVLTEEESKTNDYFTYLVYIIMLVLILSVVYLIKERKILLDKMKKEAQTV